MKKFLAILLIAFSLIVLSGVSGCNQPAEGTSAAGLQMAFVENAPPVSIAAGKEFPIYLEVTNKGDEFINPGEAKFYLSGIGPNLENVNYSLTNSGKLEKGSIFPEKLSFAEKAKFTFPITAPFSLPVVATACYSYSTTAQASLCISATNASKICSVSGEKLIALIANTEGPIQIASIKEMLSGSKLVLTIDLVNKGTGEVYILDTNCDKLEANDPRESSDKQGKVNINILSKDIFVCSLQSDQAPYGQVRGLIGIAPITRILCEKTITNEDYTSPISIVLRYKYKDSISKLVNMMPSS